jgi:hypothetical protein
LSASETVVHQNVCTYPVTLAVHYRGERNGSLWEFQSIRVDSVESVCSVTELMSHRLVGMRCTIPKQVIDSEPLKRSREPSQKSYGRVALYNPMREIYMTRVWPQQCFSALPLLVSTGHQIVSFQGAVQLRTDCLNAKSMRSTGMLQRLNSAVRQQTVCYVLDSLWIMVRIWTPIHGFRQLLGPR